MLSELINKPCTLVRRLKGSTTDDFGNTVPKIDEIDTVCELQLQSEQEPPTAGEATADVWTVFLMPGYEARAGDGLIQDDLGTFEFLGDSWVAESGSPDMWHVEGRAKRTKWPERMGAS